MNEIKKKHFRTLRILLTNECTLKCKYCCAEGHKSQYSHFNVKNIERTISIFNQYFEIDRIKLTGGEPFCVAEINDIIQQINDKFHNQTISIVSNGTNTEKISALTSAYKDLDLTISLPSLDKEMFQEITGRSDLYRNVINTVNLLGVEKRYPIKINCVLVDGFTNSVDNIRAIINRYSEYHNISIRFLELSINGVNKRDISELGYKSTFGVFLNIMLQMGYRMVENSDTRESCLFTKNGIIVKYIKYFCDVNCSVCPESKTSIWVSCDGYISCCPLNPDRQILLENFGNDEIHEKLDMNFDKFDSAD